MRSGGQLDEASPLDVMSNERWAEVLKELSNELGMMATLVDPQGNILIHVGDYTDVCVRLRKRPESLSFVCGQTSQVLMKQAQSTGEPVVELCQIGLCKLVIPIFQEGRFRGAVAACSRALAGEELDPFMVAQELGISEQEARELLERTPEISKDTLQGVARRWFRRIQQAAGSDFGA